MRSLVLTLLSVVFVAACSSTGTKGTTAKKRPQKAKVELSVPFIKGVDGVEGAKVSGSCQPQPTSWETMGWKKLNDNAANCSHEGKWSVVENLGHYMAQKHYFSPWGMYYLSLYYEHAGSLKRSLWYIEAALGKTGGASGLLYYQRGRVSLGLGDLVGAFDDFEKAVKLDPKLWDAHLYLGQQAFKDGDHAACAQHLTAVLDHGGLKGQDKFQMLAHSLEVRKKWPEALSVLDRGLRLHKNSVELRMQKARILEEETKDLRAALRAYEEILRMETKAKSQNTASIKDKIDRIRKTLQQDKDDRVPATREEKA